MSPPVNQHADGLPTRLPPLGALQPHPAGGFRSDQFGDVFFSDAGGLEESRVVFLQSGDIVNAWRGKQLFVVGELGFGTGLNFLALWDLWRRHRPPGAILHFVSVEGFLLEAADAASALALFPELADLANALIGAWPKRAFGTQRLWFEDGVCLTVGIGDVSAVLGGLSASVDAWFLDGFAPSRNPDMWSPEVLGHVARLSRPGTTLATYTVAGFVRRTLADVGFALSRLPGHGSKRERLFGVFSPQADHDADTGAASVAVPPSVLVIGAGIAGACAAHAFRRRGLAVTVLGNDPGHAVKASANPAALLMPRLDRGDTPAAQFFRDAHLAALSFYTDLPPGCFEPIGVIEWPAKDGGRARLADLGSNPPLPAELLRAGADGEIHHEGSGCLRPVAILDALLGGMDVATETVAALRREEGRWHALDAHGARIASADIVVLAAGPGSAAFDAIRAIPLELAQGQVSSAQDHPALPGKAIAGGPYALPLDGSLHFGATFDRVPPGHMPGPPLASDHARNLSALQALAPELATGIDVPQLTGRVSVRATTQDRLPCAGPVPDEAAFVARYAHLRSGARDPGGGPEPHLPGIFMVGGLGARGFAVAPLCAEVVASMALGEPVPLDRRAQEAIEPARFVKRALRRGASSSPPGA